MEDNQKPIFASVRCKRLNSIAMIVAAEKHARREDESCRNRLSEGKHMFHDKTKDNLAWSPCGDPLAIYDSFKQRKKESGASERKGSALGLHLLAIVSPELIKESGDLHDPNNPVNQRIFEQSKAWAEQEFGAGSLIHARMDMDEKGGGVVDLVVVPVHEQTIRGKTKNIISTRKALSQVSDRWGDKRSFSALQNSFADYAKHHIDDRIVRGVPKEISDALHHTPDVLRNKDEELSERQSVLEEQERDIQERNRHNANQERIISERQSVLEEQERDIQERARHNAKQERTISERSSKLASENLSFEKKRLFSAQVWDVLRDEVKRIYKHVTDAKSELKELQDKGGKWGEFFRSLVGKSLDSIRKEERQAGVEQGRNERQPEINNANDRAVSMEKQRDKARDDLKREKSERAKDSVIPKGEALEYARWKSEQRTKEYEKNHTHDRVFDGLSR